jgi:FMN phosphatase YigB (HAD superfamily)
LDIADNFDFILTSEDCKAQKPQQEIFDLALQRAKCSNPLAAYHVGESIDVDVLGAAAAGWTAMRINEDFDNDFPDWLEIDPAERADEGAQRRFQLMSWGRRDPARGLDWVELWGLDDVLTLFGFPEDESKPIRTTYIRNFRGDE